MEGTTLYLGKGAKSWSGWIPRLNIESDSLENHNRRWRIDWFATATEFNSVPADDDHEDDKHYDERSDGNGKDDT